MSDADEILKLHAMFTAKDAEIARLTAELEMCREDAGRYRWIKANATERLTDESATGGEFAEHKTQFVLPKLISWADFCGQIALDDAIDAARSKP